MFASERNVELVSKIVTDVIHLVELRLRHFTLDSVTRLTELLSILVVVFFVALFLFLGLMVGSIATFFWLSDILGTGWAVCVVTGFYFLLAALIVLFWKPLIQVPMSIIIGNILLERRSGPPSNNSL